MESNCAIVYCWSYNGRFCEDIRPAIDDASFASIIRSAKDELYDALHVMLYQTETPLPVSGNESCAEESPQQPTTTVNDFEADYACSDSDAVQPTVGDCIEVYWPLDRQYYAGRIEKHSFFSDPGQKRVLYDDGEVEDLHLDHETWRFCSARCEPAPSL